MDIFSIDNIRLGGTVADKEAALAAIAAFAVERGYAADAAGVVQGLQEREALMSTSLMDGIAIPHAKHAAVQSAALLIQRFDASIAWSGDDVRVTLAMLVPEVEAGTTHLRLLAQVSRALMDDDLRAVLNNGSAADIFGALADRIA